MLFFFIFYFLLESVYLSGETLSLSFNPTPGFLPVECWGSQVESGREVKRNYAVIRSREYNTTTVIIRFVVAPVKRKIVY